MKKRDLNLDLIRSAAVFLVISIHFFLNSGFYSVPVLGEKMYILTAFRTASMMCVPLFLLLTGYLMCKKELSAKYYKGIIKTLVIFGICSALCFIYRRLYLHTQLDLKTVITGTLSDWHYSWYIGLYMGLFFIIPFLNLAYNGLKKRSHKRILIFTLLSLTAMPGAANYIFKTIPDTFIGMYPITYYFIGAYIREYQDDFKGHIAFLLFAVSLLLSSGVNIAISHGKPFVYDALNDWGGIENLLSATFFFVFLKKLNLKRCPQVIAAGITKISEWSLAAYLLSWIFDNYAYAKLFEAVPSEEARWVFYPVMVLFTFVCSLALSALVNAAYGLAASAAAKNLAKKHTIEPL